MTESKSNLQEPAIDLNMGTRHLPGRDVLDRETLLGDSNRDISRRAISARVCDKNSWHGISLLAGAKTSPRNYPHSGLPDAV